MKVQVSRYAFNKTAKTVTFLDYNEIKKENILAIVSNGTFIYNCTNNALLGTVNKNVLTLAYDTSGMNDTDPLQILYEDAEGVSVTDFAIMLKNLMMIIANPPTTDKSLNKVRVDVSGQSVVVSSATLAANQDIRTVATVTNLSTIDTYPGKLAVVGINTSAWASSVRNLIT